MTRRREEVAARDRLLLPHRDEHAASQARRWAGAARPRSLPSYLRWGRWAYRQEPPVRVHVRDLASDGTPRWSGDFAAWVAGIDSGTACATDDEGFYRWPLRCALFAMHGRYEDGGSAAMADLLLDLLASDRTLADVAAEHGVTPSWVVPIVAAESLRRLWEMYAPQPR